MSAGPPRLPVGGCALHPTSRLRPNSPPLFPPFRARAPPGSVAAGTGALERDWSGQWVFDAFWEVLYFAVLAAIGYLWRPTENSLRYAYMQELATTEADARDEEDEAYLGDVAREEADVQAALDADMQGDAAEGKGGAHGGASDTDSDGSHRHAAHHHHHRVAGSDAERAGLATNLSSDSEDGDI